MSRIEKISRFILFLFFPLVLLGENPSPSKAKLGKSKALGFVEACLTAQAQIDQDINNVRARLLTGGDMWWDRTATSGKYVVPKPKLGEPAVSAIFAAGVWLGGMDPGGNLKTACQTYGNIGGDSDFWPGPLDQTGKTEQSTCHFWDRFFEVKGTDIRQHFQHLNARKSGIPYTADKLPSSLKSWPANGNPYFESQMYFALPSSNQGLAPFYDNDGDRAYEPLDGDYPIIGLEGCFNEPVADQLIFWLYNDEGGGNYHGETKGISIGMEIQATAFAFATDNQLNDMTFQRHKFINKALEDIDSFHFALWVDPNLGCPYDDYLGCDPARSMSFVYNKDDVDGQPGTSCGGIPTYGNNIPAIGIDVFIGPKDEHGAELGMGSFMYYNTAQDPPPGTLRPSIDVEFYRYMTGSWRDGARATFSGDGYDPVAATDPGNHFNYAFPDLPGDANGWSMCHPGTEFPQGLPDNVRNFVQSYGPMTLQPGAVNQLVFGVVYAPDLDYPCPIICAAAFFVFLLKTPLLLPG